LEKNNNKEEEELTQILPRTLSERSFQNEQQVPDETKLADRKGIYSRSRSLVKKVKETSEEEALDEGLVEEMSLLVSEIEATLKVHEDMRELADQNPLSQKKKTLTARLEALTQELENSRSAVAMLKRENQLAAKQEKTLKEELAREMEQKEAQESKVQRFVRETLEKDAVIKKTLQNIQQLLQHQKNLEQELANTRKLRNNLFKQARQKEQEVFNWESKLTATREKLKSLESQLQKAELHRELRGRHLKNLEQLIAMSDSSNELAGNGNPFFGAAVKAVRALITAAQISHTKSEQVDTLEGIELLQKHAALSLELEQLRQEKLLFQRQYTILETQLQLTDADEDDARSDSQGLRDQLKQLYHQNALLEADRDGIRKQINGLRQSSAQEKIHKGKILDKIKVEISSQLRIQHFLKQLIMDEYKAFPSSHNSNSSTVNSSDDSSSPLDIPAILKLQAILEEHLGSDSVQNVNNKQLTIELLGRILKGEKISDDIISGSPEQPTRSKKSMLVLEVPLSQSRKKKPAAPSTSFPLLPFHTNTLTRQGSMKILGKRIL
jgi:chromosome segregation ATPase